MGEHHLAISVKNSAYQQIQLPEDMERLNRNRDIKPVIQINPLKIGYRAFALFKLSFVSR